MKVEIIGNGSMGMLYGSKLIQAGYSVHFWTRTAEQAKQLQSSGITFENIEGNKNKVLHGTYTQLEDEAISQHIIEQVEEIYLLLTVKQSQLDEKLLAHIERMMSSNRYYVLVAFQNGIGHIERLAQITNKPIITAVTSEAAHRIHSSEVRHTGIGTTTIGDQLGRDFDYFHQKNMEVILNKAGFHTRVSKNIIEQVYSKLIANAVINPLTALFGVKNGQLLLDESKLQLMERLFEETRYILTFDEPSLAQFAFQQVLHICEATSSNTSSMLGDILAKRETEIQYINGAIVKLASQHEQAAPLNTALEQLILALHPEK